MKSQSLYAFMLSLLSAGTLCAAPVGRNDALASARKFLEARGMQANLRESNLTRSFPDTEQPAPYHIFNLDNNGGYIIIAGDDRARTVLAYSLSGRLDEDSLPEACEAWLSQYASEISSMPQGEATTRMTPDYPTTPVEPILKSQWNQTDPYNRECPQDAEGNRYATGCVATGVAQIMYHYRYPERATGAMTYENLANHEILSIDFADYPSFDWANMTDTYSSESSEESCNAVASLMKAVGYASKMRYSYASGALHSDAAKALINHFGYDANIHSYDRAIMTDKEWRDLIIGELLEGRPVLYDGFNPVGGHSFVCDGYDGNGYFHFNWGWSGLSDGYYSLSALTPPAQSTGGTNSGYNHRQSILCRIAPPGMIESIPQTDYIFTLQTINFRSEEGIPNSIDVLEWVSTPEYAQLYINAFNKGVPDFTGEACAAVIDNETVTPVLIKPINNLEVHDYAGLSFPISDTNLKEGTYRIGFFYRKDANDSWHRILPSAYYPAECKVKIESDKITMSVEIPEIRLEMASGLSHYGLQTNSDYKWNFTMANTGDNRFEGYAGVALSSKADGTVSFFSTPVIIPPGENAQVELKGKFQDFPDGEYQTIPYYSYASEPTMGDIIPLSRPEKVMVTALGIIPGNGTFFLLESADKPLSLTILNSGKNPWEGMIEGELVTADGTEVGSFISPEIRIEGGDNIRTTLSSLSVEVTRGYYTMKLYAGPGRDNLLNSVQLVAMSDISGVDDVVAEAPSVTTSGGFIRITATSPIEEVSLYDIAGSLCRKISSPGYEAEIDASSLPGGIYILKTLTTDGKSTTVKVRI